MDRTHGRQGRVRQNIMKARTIAQTWWAIHLGAIRSMETNDGDQAMTVLMTGGGEYVGAVLVSSWQDYGSGHRSLLFGATCSPQPLELVKADIRDEGLPGHRGSGLGDPPRLHLERPELRAQPGAGQLDQLHDCFRPLVSVSPGRPPVRLRLDLRRPG
jgi:hypothetical protein